MAGVKGMKRGRPMGFRHQEDVRKKIQVDHIFERLKKHIAGDIEMSSTQIAAAKILLDKAVSNAPQQTEITGADGEPFRLVIGS